jgi:hypothetical protein
MPSRAEVLGDGSICRQKALGVTRGLEPLHASLTLTGRPMRILTPVVEIPTLPMLDAGQHLALRRSVAFQLVRDEHAGHIA